MKEIQGWMSADECKWLEVMASTMKSVVEIGSWKGKSTQSLLIGCKGPVFAVDHFLGSEDERSSSHAEANTTDIFLQFWENVGSFKNLVSMRMTSVEASKFFADKSVDVVFIDGCHNRTNVITDLTVWLSKAKRLICGHDYGQIGGKSLFDELNLQAVEVGAGSIWQINL
jgi:hypothetical protein